MTHVVLGREIVQRDSQPKRHGFRFWIHAIGNGEGLGFKNFNLRHRRYAHVFLSRNNSASRKFVTVLPRVVTALAGANAGMQRIKNIV